MITKVAVIATISVTKAIWGATIENWFTAIEYPPTAYRGAGEYWLTVGS